MSSRLLGLAAAALALSVVACGPADVGEECAQVYVEGECIDGAVCVQDDFGDRTCRPIADIGDPCSNEGEWAECESGAICGKDTLGGIECLQVCNDHADCPAGQDCNGVEGTSVKGCRQKI